MTQKPQEPADYYGIVQIEVQVLVKAVDEDDAQNQIDDILGGICFDSHLHFESIDYEAHSILEVNTLEEDNQGS